MFQRVLRTWDRLVGRQHESAVAEDERRAWVRIPCDVEITCQPADDPQRLSARVQDVSLGGINLVVSRRFDPGALLSINLPGGTEQCSCIVLAFVVHVREESGAWAVGCTFAAELGDDDLQRFGARRLKPCAPDQRAWVRFPCDAQASYQLVRPAGAALLPARILNISPTGVGLLADQAVAAGALLSVDLRGADGAAVVTIMASVVRVTVQPGSGWALGCNFIRELTEQELQALL